MFLIFCSKFVTGTGGLRARKWGPGLVTERSVESQKRPFLRLLTGDSTGLANLQKNCCNTCLEINVSKPLIRVEF